MDAGGYRKGRLVRINHAFSKPAVRADDSLDYVAIQILAEGFQT